MVLTALLIDTVGPWVAEKIFGEYEEKYITPKLKSLLFKPEEYKIQLTAAIRKTVVNYEEKFPPTGKFPFYHHKETFTQLSKFILFEDQGKNILESINFGELENIEKPTREQVEHFYNYFVTEVKADNKLKDFYIEENYKSKIFEIYREISLIKNMFEDFINAIPKTEDLIKSWIEQIYDNLQKLKSSTALSEINRFETEVLSKNQISDRNKAFMYFVKGLCLNENAKPQEAADYFGQACILDPENKSYIAWNLYLQYLFNYSPEIFENINTALKANPFDPILHASLTLESLKDSTFAFNNVNISIQNNIRFKRIIYLNYLKKGTVEQALNYFATDNTDINAQLNNVTIDNYHYLSFYLQLYFINLLRNYPNHLFFKINKNLVNSIELEHCISYFTRYLEKIKNSEKTDLKGLFEYMLEIAIYFKNGAKVNLENAYHIYQKNQNVISSYYFNLLKWGFSQTGDFETALKLFSEKENEIEEYYFKAMLHHRLGDEVGRKNALEEYLLKITQIDDLNIDSIIDATIQSNLDSGNLNLFYERIQKNEIAVDGVYKDIIIACKGVQQESFMEDSIKILQNNFRKINEDASASNELINSYCRLLHAYELWVGIVELFDKKNVNSFQAKTLLIEALHYTKLNATRLLKLLEELRNDNEHPFDRYYIWEINLKSILGLWDKVEDIAKKGQILFPTNKAFSFYLAISYAHQDKKKDFLELLDLIDLINFRFENFQSIAQALLKFEENTLAIEWAYNYTIKHNGAEHRAFFFNLYMFNYERTGHIIPSGCEEGYFITIQSSSKTLTVNVIDNESIFKKLVGKKVGDSIFLAGTMSAKEIEYQITGIHHKYDILIKSIGQEAENPEITGIPMQSFQLKEGGTLEDWNKQLMEQLGDKGEETNIHCEKAINQYKAGSLSFLQITRNVFNDDIIKAYIGVTNWSDTGFRAIPANLFKITTEQAKNKPCLDLPTLILFAEINKTHSVEFYTKFIISQHTAAYINGLLIATQNEVPAELSLNITSNSVIPSFNQKEKHELKLSILQNCKSWMDLNCEIQTSTEKLNIIFRIQSEQGTVNDLVLSYMDTMALTIDNKTILISDEKIAFGAFKETNQIASAEYYLSYFSRNIDSDTLFDFLSARNYIGIRIPESKISLVTKAILNQESNQENIFQNISIQNSGNSNNVPMLILIMQEVLRSGLGNTKKNELIRNLFEKLFEGVYPNQPMLQNVIDLVSLSLLQFLIADNKGLKIISRELFTVLKKHGVSVEFRKK